MSEQTLAARLRAARLNAGLTLSDVGEKCGIGSQYVWKLENGKKKPSFEMVCKLADALGVKLDDLRPE